MNVLTAKYIISEETVTVSLSGEIDHHSARVLREEIDRKLDELRPQKLILDMSGIGFMDSSGLGLILGRHTKMKAFGGNLTLLDPSKGVERVLRLATADKIIPIERTEENSK